WGYNNYGQCNVTSPNSGFVAVAAVYEHSLGLKADGSIVAWGYNDYRQCNVPSPNSDYVAVAAGYSHSLGIRESGASPTQTPIPTLTPTPTPTKIPANTAPSVQVMTPPSPASGFISINYVLRDAQSDHVNLEVWFSINGGSSFIPASMGLGGDGITNLETTFNSVLHTYIWNTNSDIGSQLADNVKIKMRTFDGDLYSTKSTSGIFTVDNRASLPEITGIVKDIRSGEIIKGVLVELLSDITGELIDSDVTDTSGKYTVSAPDGNNVLKIKFSKVGYDPKEIRGFTAPMIMNINLNPGTPLSPTGLIAVSGASEVLVRWNPNMESDLAGYNVYRDTTTTGTFTKINIALVKETSYRDTSAMSGNEYYYKVTAVDKDANESLPAGPVKAVSGLVIVTVPDISGEKGTCVRIPINVDNAAGINPWGIDIDFRYNATLVDTVTSGVKIERTAVTSNVSFIANTQEPGRIRISSIGQADTLRGEGHLFDIYLWLRPDVPEGICGLLNFAEVKFYNEVPALIPADYTDTGLMCVSIECMQGDLNGDKMVDSADVIIALKMAVGLIIPIDCQMQSGDINGDGVIDSADALMIQRLSVGLPINPPQQGQGSEKSSIKDMTLRSLLGRKQAISIQVGQGQTSPGGYVFIPVEISDATGLSGLDMTIGYPSDRSTIILDSINSGSLTGNFQKTFYYGSGYAKVSMSSQSALTSGSGSLVVLKFRVSYTAPAPSAISITLNDIKLKGQYGDSFDWYSTIQKSDGEIQVLSTILTQKDFTDFLLGKTKSLYGDLNGDGKVDVADLVTLIINQP
ncbi:MAG: cohesin domain-containing protein, partial [Candidatus Sumerlaeota bacterium]|nr:cohesin domain-containing protein [Candidatus Sumerlaeota bacterium]